MIFSFFQTVYQMLREWYEKETNQATCGKLCQTLWEVDERVAVEKLAKYRPFQNKMK